MFKNILVPVDLSEKNKRALEIAMEMAQTHKGAVRLLHVIETLADTDFGEIKDFYSRLEKSAWKKLDALTQPYQNQATEISSQVAYGDRTTQILRFAGETGTDLIVMHSHRIRTDNPAQGWGTISYKVGILSQCPVLLVK